MFAIISMDVSVDVFLCLKVKLELNFRYEFL